MVVDGIDVLLAYLLPRPADRRGVTELGELRRDNDELRARVDGTIDAIREVLDATRASG
jgi:hypothetical protein